MAQRMTGHSNTTNAVGSPHIPPTAPRIQESENCTTICIVVTALTCFATSKNRGDSAARNHNSIVFAAGNLQRRVTLCPDSSTLYAQRSTTPAPAPSTSTQGLHRVLLAAAPEHSVKLFPRFPVVSGSTPAQADIDLDLVSTPFLRHDDCLA